MPAFDSLEAAMRWTYGHRADTTKLSSLNAMMGRVVVDEDQEAPVRSSNPDLERKPGGWDSVAQIGLLKAFVQNLPVPSRYHILAKYSRGEDRRAAQRLLRDLILPLLTTTLRPRWTVYQLVARYYGRTVYFKDLSVKLRPFVPQDAGEKPEPYDRRVWRMVRQMSFATDGYLKDLATRAEESAYAALRERGVIL